MNKFLLIFQVWPKVLVVACLILMGLDAKAANSEYNKGVQKSKLQQGLEVCTHVLTRPLRINNITDVKTGDKLSLQKILKLQPSEALQTLNRHLQKTRSKTHHFFNDRNALLLYAVRKSATRLVALAVKAGADVDYVRPLAETNGHSAVEIAILDNNFTMLKLLVDDLGADTNTRYSKYYDKPIHVAARTRNLEVVKFLLSRGARVREEQYNTDDPHDRITPLKHLEDVIAESAPLSATARAELGQVVYTILEHSKDIESSDLDKVSNSYWGSSFLTYAAYLGWEDVVEWMIDLGVDPNKRESSDLDVSPLFAAVLAGHNNDKIIRALLAGGAEPDASFAWKPLPHKVVRPTDRKKELEFKYKHSKNIYVSAWSEIQQQKRLNPSNWQISKVYHLLEEATLAANKNQ